MLGIENCPRHGTETVRLTWAADVETIWLRLDDFARKGGDLADLVKSEAAATARRMTAAEHEGRENPALSLVDEWTEIYVDGDPWGFPPHPLAPTLAHLAGRYRAWGGRLVPFPGPESKPARPRRPAPAVERPKLL